MYISLVDGQKRHSGVSSVGSTSSPSCGSLLSMATQAGSSMGYGSASGGATSPTPPGGAADSIKCDPGATTWCRREHKCSSSELDFRRINCVYWSDLLK